MTEQTMTERKIKLIALDLDQTTLRRDKSLSDRNRNAIEQAIAAGIHVAVASGRAFASLPSAVTGIPGLEYAVTSNGAAIYHIPTGKRCQEFPLDPSAVDQILGLVPISLAIEAFWEGRPYGGTDYVANPEAYGAAGSAAAYVKATRTPVPDIRAFIREHRTHLDALEVILSTLEERDTLWKQLEAAIPELYITSSAPSLLELSQTAGGKRCGLEWLGKKLGILPDEIAAFGDAENDCDMIRYAGLGVAMGNGHPLLQEAADMVTVSNEEDGVALVIEQILKGSGQFFIS